MSKRPTSDFAERDRFTREAVSATFQALGSRPLEEALAKEGRRAAPRRAALERQALRLDRDAEGILRWRIGAEPAPGPGREALARRAGLRRAPLAAKPALSQTLFDKLEPSKVGEWLRRADRLLTRPAWNEKGQLWGLRRMLPNGKLTPFELEDLPGMKGKKVLVFVHGTFSHCEAILDDLKKAPGGDEMLKAAFSTYDLVLCFDHPTLSVSPTLNAFDLASRFAQGVPASVDLVAHSRGGLVARWFCEGFRHTALPCRAVLVGAPLAGTSLASPARVTSVMDFLANVGDAVATVSSAAGGVFLGFASTLAGLFARVTGALATPLADAIVALVPGLAAQSREGGNAELRALRANTGWCDFRDPASQVRYFVIRSDFSPVEDGVWGFLKSFVTRPGAAALDLAANAIFEGPNDLVVDVASMSETGEHDGQPSCLVETAHDFGASRSVHHCNYFEQRVTVKAIRASLGF